MQALIAFAVLLALGASAQANVAPFERPMEALSANVSAIDTAPSSAMLEADYFRALPPPTAAGQVFCRLRMFEKTRLAQSCH